MSARTAAFCARLGIDHPIVQAPMGGSTTPELVAAVSNAGGLGSLPGSYLAPESLRAQIEAVRRLTDRPFGVVRTLVRERKATLASLRISTPA